ncbi:MAG: HEAT repeat domain-containing protein, partial [Syntrophobacterales bacterium]|nr:HEAT repeat domain-containing protein [Syntrophobacterales bacterium]
HGRPIAFGEIIHLVCAALLPVAGFFLWKEKSIFKMRKKGKYAFITILSSVSVSLAVSAYFFGINITHAERLGWQFVPGSLVNGFCLLSAAMFAAAVLFSGQNRSLIRNAAAAAIIFSGIYLLWHVYLSMIVHPAMPILLPVAYIVLAGTFLSREKAQKIKSSLPPEPAEIEEAAQSQPIQRIQLVNAARAVFNNPFSSMVFDPDDTLWKEPIQKELDLLVMGGTKSVVVFDELLMQCASGRGESISHSWWYGSVWAIKTAAMLPRKEAAELMMRLLQQDSNIWEWFSYVQNEAARQLAGIGNADVLPALQNFLEHPPFAMSPVDAIAKTVEKLGGIVKESPSVILSKAQNQLGDGDGIDYLLPFMEQMQSWDSKDKGFYYFLLAKKSERLGYVNAARAFFAAQVAANPVPSDWVWQVFSSEGITPSPENALKLHNKYPVPKTMDEIKSYDVK